MREIQASEAKTHLPHLLDEAERGGTVIIARHGRSIARLVPDAARRQTEIEEAVRDIKAIQKRTGRVTVEEILSATHEGHEE